MVSISFLRMHSYPEFMDNENQASMHFERFEGEDHAITRKSHQLNKYLPG